MLKLTLRPQELDISTVDLDLTGLTLLNIFVTTEGSETPVLGDNDLLATRELVLGSPQSLDCGGTVGVTCTNRQNDLADVDTGDSAVRLTPGTTHTSLKPIGSGARQHLIDTNNVERVSTDPHVKPILSGNLDKILVGANTSGFKSLRRKLLVLIRDQVDTEREFVDTSTLASQIKDPDLRVGDTAVEARLGVRLVLAVAVATGRAAGHLFGFLGG
jgi:hypothetical protein